MSALKYEQAWQKQDRPWKVLGNPKTDNKSNNNLNARHWKYRYNVLNKIFSYFKKYTIQLK